MEVRGPGQLVLQPGAERRRTSSHYTPRSLSAPIVRRALEPLLKAMGDQPSSERLLNLKICDPAMGSGRVPGRGLPLPRGPGRRRVDARGGAGRGAEGRGRGDARPPAGGAALPLRCGQEPVGGEPGQAVAVARHPGEGRAVHLPRPRAQVRRLAGRARPRADPGVPLERREAEAVRPRRRRSSRGRSRWRWRSGRRSFSSHSIWSARRSTRPKQLGLDPAKQKEELLRDADEALRR